MANFLYMIMNRIYYNVTVIITCLIIFIGCSSVSKERTEVANETELYNLESLEYSIRDVVDSAPGVIGVALVTDKDTLIVNNGVQYPLMSVFKLHQALAVVHRLETQNRSIDSLLHIRYSELDMDTWSPMLKKYTEGDFDISLRDLVGYSIILSDNNASNLLFNHVISPQETNRYIKGIANDSTFQILHSEADMKTDHDISYQNYSSPLAASLLIKQVFNDSLLTDTNQQAIRQMLTTVTTGQDRLGAVLLEAPDILFAHKTGSGYRNTRGELIAYNDIGYFRLPDGRDYALAVMIRDFRGTEPEAAEIMAKISKIVYKWI